MTDQLAAVLADINLDELHCPFWFSIVEVGDREAVIKIAQLMCAINFAGLTADDNGDQEALDRHAGNLANLLEALTHKQLMSVTLALVDGWCGLAEVAAREMEKGEVSIKDVAAEGGYTKRESAA